MTAAATTTTYSAKAIDDLPELWDGFARLVRAGLGITAFGAQIMQLPADYTTESHDEADTGQQELYVALGGTGAVVIGNERLPLDPDHLVRVDAGTSRVLTSGPDGLRVLCIGAVPGRAYEPPAWTTGRPAATDALRRRRRDAASPRTEQRSAGSHATGPDVGVVAQPPDTLMSGTRFNSPRPGMGRSSFWSQMSTDTRVPGVSEGSIAPNA